MRGAAHPMTRRRWLVVAAVTGAVLILAATRVRVWPWERVYNVDVITTQNLAIIEALAR
jgi:hypothetical protein